MAVLIVRPGSSDERTLNTPRPVARELADDDLLAPGTMLGEYRVEGFIGRGGMGVVYSAVHPRIGKRAAIKILKRELCREQFAVERFVDEARVVNQIGHPNIVDVFAFGETEDGRSYFAMEWLKGETLSCRIARSRLALDEIHEIVKPLIGALAAAHAQGVIHRDLKPENVFLYEVPGEQPRLKLLDFGIAKLASEDHRVERTATGAIVGTPQYISPEQARGGTIDARADVYSLGAIVFELFTGRPPFVADNAMEMIAKHLMEPPPRPSSLVSMTPELDELVVAMLAKDPDARPSLVEVGAWFERTTSLDRTIVRTMPVREQARETSDLAAPPIGTTSGSIEAPRPRMAVAHSAITVPAELVPRRRSGAIAASVIILIAGFAGFWFAQRGNSDNPNSPAGTDQNVAGGSTSGRQITSTLIDPPTADKPTVDKPTVDPPTVDKPTVDRPTVDKPTGRAINLHDKRRVRTREPKPRPEVTPTKQKLALHITGATRFQILIDGKRSGATTDLAPGTYSLIVCAKGMQTYSTTIEIKNVAVTKTVPLTPLADGDLLRKGCAGHN